MEGHTVAERLADVDGLGALHTVHGAGRIPKACLVVAGVVLGVAVVIALVDGGSAATVLGTVAFGLLCALVVTAFALVFRPLRKVGVYDGGFAVAEWGRVQSWRWDDVVSLTSLVRRQRATVVGIPIVSVMAHQHRLRRTDGRRLTLTHGLRGVGDVVDTINSAVMPAHRTAGPRHTPGGRDRRFRGRYPPPGRRALQAAIPPLGPTCRTRVVDGVLTLRDITGETKPIVSTCQKITNVHALLMILRTVSAPS